MAKLSSQIRKNLKEQSFAVPGKRKLPIEDANHARNAAARVNQTKGLSPGERKLAHAKIKAAEKKFGIKSK